MAICSECNEYTNDYTWLRQRTLCRTCWELKNHDELQVRNIKISSGLVSQHVLPLGDEEE